MSPRRRAALLLALGAVVCACGTLRTGSRFSEQQAATELPSLVAGTTTRADLLLQFGPPWRSFEDDSIFAWRVARTGGASPDGVLWRPAAVRQAPGLPMGAWYNAHSLVVVFSGDVVSRFALVRVR